MTHRPLNCENLVLPSIEIIDFSTYFMPSRRFAYLSFPRDGDASFFLLYSAFLPKMLPAVLPDAEIKSISRYISIFCALIYSARSFKSERLPRRESRDALIMLD